MELNAKARPLSLGHRHHRAVFGPGRQLERRREALALGDQRVVAGREERRRQAAQDPGALVVNAGRATMDRAIGLQDLAALGFHKALMPGENGTSSTRTSTQQLFPGLGGSTVSQFSRKKNHSN